MECIDALIKGIENNPSVNRGGHGVVAQDESSPKIEGDVRGGDVNISNSDVNMVVSQETKAEAIQHLQGIKKLMEEEDLNLDDDERLNQKVEWFRASLPLFVPILEKILTLPIP